MKIFQKPPFFSFATLEEVLLAFPHTPINIDIKQTAPNVIPYEQQLAELLLKYGRKDDVIVASFNDAALDAFNALKTGIGTACGPRAVASFAMALAQGESVKPYIRQHVAIQVKSAISYRPFLSSSRQLLEGCPISEKCTFPS